MQWLSAAVAALLPAVAAALPSLEEGFAAPPNDAKPQTWWHWMNGNVTKEGVTADLEAMAQPTMKTFRGSLTVVVAAAPDGVAHLRVSGRSGLCSETDISMTGGKAG